MARDKPLTTCNDGVFSTSYPLFTIFKHSKKTQENAYIFLKEQVKAIRMDDFITEVELLFYVEMGG